MWGYKAKDLRFRKPQILYELYWFKNQMHNLDGNKNIFYFLLIFLE